MHEGDLTDAVCCVHRILRGFKCKDPCYPDLSVEQQYFVLGIEADDYRI